jgi:hypothetical protein
MARLESDTLEIARLRSLGGSESQVFGVEIDEGVHAQVTFNLAQKYRIRIEQLIRSDFFGIHRGFAPHMSAIIGNPPFIRFQRFQSRERDRADILLRRGRPNDAQELVDKFILVDSLGLTRREVVILQQAIQSLRERRTGRNSPT